MSGIGPKRKKCLNSYGLHREGADFMDSMNARSCHARIVRNIRKLEQRRIPDSASRVGRALPIASPSAAAKEIPSVKHNNSIIAAVTDSLYDLSRPRGRCPSPITCRVMSAKRQEELCRAKETQPDQV